MDKTSPTVGKNLYLAEQFQSVEAYMKEHLCDMIGLDDISHGCSMSVSKLSTLFRQYKGCSPMAHFNYLRIEEAKRLIETTSMNMTEISDKLGFGSSQYFSKVFKKNAGVTPTEYAKNAAL